VYPVTICDEYTGANSHPLVRDSDKHVYVYIYIYVHTLYLYINQHMVNMLMHALSCRRLREEMVNVVG